MIKSKDYKNKYLINSSSSLIFLVCLFCICCSQNKDNKKFNVSEQVSEIDQFSNQGNWSKAIDLAELLLQDSDAIDVSDKLNIYLAFGKNYRFLERYPEAEEEFKKVISHPRANENFSKLGEAYYGLADLNYLKWSYFKEEDALQTSRNYLDSSMVFAAIRNNPSLESKILYRQGTIYQIQGRSEESKRCFEKGLHISFAAQDTVGIIRNDIHKAAELESDGALDSALFHYTRAYNYAAKINRKYAEAHSLCNLGLFYLDQNDLPKAEDYFVKARVVSEELNHRIVLCRSYYGLAEVYSKLDRRSEALDLANRGMQLAREKGYKNYEHAFVALIESLTTN